MALRAPRLDRRSFEELVELALTRAREASPEWTDQSPHDPGVVLVEAFAYLTQELIQRFNELPEEAYVAFLELMGVQRVPPSAARAEVRIELARPAASPVAVPEGTRIGAGREGGGEPVIFCTSEPASIASGATSVDVVAHHCDWLSEEMGRGTGVAGQVVQVARPPIVAPLPGGIELVVGVEAGEEEGPARVFEGARFQLWREVESFAGIERTERVYVVDRVAGRISFAPALHAREPDGGLEARPEAIAVVPAANARIRVWYRCGGGRRGNVPTGALSQLLSAIPGARASNLEPAIGGRDAESVEHALRRGPLDIHSLRRAVTARDYEMWAVRSCGAINRALAVTRAERWKFAQPGTIEITAVPTIPAVSDSQLPVRLEDLQAHARAGEDELKQLVASLEIRKPLGTRCVVRWARYKRVRVRARVVAHRAEDPIALRERILARLGEVITPIRREEGTGGWPFGVAVRASHVYGILLAEPGVLWVEPVRLLVDDVPSTGVTALAHDPSQTRTWYAASSGRLFRSENGGNGWERIQDPEVAEDGAATGSQLVRPHSRVPGLLARLSASTTEEGEVSDVRISRDCGESFVEHRSAGWRIRDAAWATAADATPVLFLAGEQGLHRLRAEAGATLEPVQVAPRGDVRLFAVATGRDRQARDYVAVASESEGIFVSIQGGRPGTFRRLDGLERADIRVLRIARHGIHDYLWAGVMDFSQSGAVGCRRWRLLGAEDPPERWEDVSEGWDASGSCLDLALADDRVFAATAKGGVLRASLAGGPLRWEQPPIDSGLDPSDDGRFAPLHALAFDPFDGPEGRLLCGGERGVLCSLDGGRSFTNVSQPDFLDRVTLPPGWLPCSGDHDIEIVHELDAPRD